MLSEKYKLTQALLRLWLFRSWKFYHLDSMNKSETIALVQTAQYLNHTTAYRETFHNIPAYHE